ncbi:MAG: hypothetical protein RL716_1152 [Actinomycetota bacterium]
MEQFDQNTPLFAISVAAELAVMHPQTLRDYENPPLHHAKRRPTSRDCSPV